MHVVQRESGEIVVQVYKCLIPPDSTPMNIGNLHSSVSSTE